MRVFMEMVSVLLAETELVSQLPNPYFLAWYRWDAYEILSHYGEAN